MIKGGFTDMKDDKQGEYSRDEKEIHHMKDKPSDHKRNIEDLSEEELVRRIENLKRRKRESKEPSGGVRDRGTEGRRSLNEEQGKETSRVRREGEKSRRDLSGRSERTPHRDEARRPKPEGRGPVRPARDRDDNFEDKRERFVSGKSSGSKGLIKTAAVIVLILGVVGGIFFSSRRGPAIKVERVSVSDPVDYSTLGKIEMTQVKAEEIGDSVVIPLADVKEKKIVGFEYSKVTIPSGFGAARPFPLVAYIAPSGKLVTGVSLCEPCKSTLFWIDPSDITLTCKACGTKWNLETLEGISGGCPKYPPDEFQHEIKDGKIYIKSAGIESWKPRI